MCVCVCTRAGLSEQAGWLQYAPAAGKQRVWLWEERLSNEEEWWVHTHTHPQLYELFYQYELLLSAISSVKKYNCVVGWGRCGRGGSAQLKEEFSPSLMPLWVSQTHVIYSVHYKPCHPIISLLNRGLTFTVKILHQLSELLLNVSITTQTSRCPSLTAHWENEQLSVDHYLTSSVSSFSFTSCQMWCAKAFTAF